MGELLSFHFVLISKGLTTYEYIISQREKQAFDGEGTSGFRESLNNAKGVLSCICCCKPSQVGCYVFALYMINGVAPVQGWPEPYMYHICTVYIPTAFLAAKAPNIRSYTVCIYGSGQPYSCAKGCVLLNPSATKTAPPTAGTQ